MKREPDELGVLGKEIDGRYRLVRFIGAGTMGAVYEGTQIAVGRRVAIKLLNAALQTNEQIRERFRVEAQAIATLSHPNCVTLFDFGFAEELGALYMAVEYLDGDSLDQMITNGLAPRTALLLSRQIAEVLAVAHAAGIMHRDLKPENVMVVEAADGSTQAKVLDFGLARIFEDATSGARLTRQGQLFGTPAYMSPEQCRSAMDVGPPADIYALGVSMFEMLMGRLPFESPSVPELLVLHSTKTAPPVASSDEIPLEVSAMIARMMAKNPEDRPTAEETAEILSAILDGHTPPALAPPSSVTGEREVDATRATLAMTGADEDATTTGMSMEPEPTSMPPVAIGALLLSILLLLGAVGIAMSANNQPTTPAVLEKPAPAPLPTPSAEAPPEPTEEPAPTDELSVAPDLAADQGAHLASELEASALAIAEAQPPARAKRPDQTRPARGEKLRPGAARIGEFLRERREKTPRRKTKKIRGVDELGMYE